MSGALQNFFALLLSPAVLIGLSEAVATPGCGESRMVRGLHWFLILPSFKDAI